MAPLQLRTFWQPYHLPSGDTVHIRVVLLWDNEILGELETSDVIAQNEVLNLVDSKGNKKVRRFPILKFLNSILPLFNEKGINTSRADIQDVAKEVLDKNVRFISYAQLDFMTKVSEANGLIKKKIFLEYCP